MIFCVDVVTADTSKLKNRGLAFAFTSSPYMITAFAGPKAAEGFFASNWRWGFGAFAIIIPAVAIPMASILFIARRKAQKTGMLIKGESGRNWHESLMYYFIEFDCKPHHFLSYLIAKLT
jgi:MFS family permease